MLFHYPIREYYLYNEYVDMRKGIDSLYGIVNNELRKNPLTGDLFVFIGKRKNQLKILHWQGDGFALFYKRLERGRFEKPTYDEGALSSILNSEQLLFILQGVVLKSIKKHKRYTHVDVNN
jgi:transposase